MSNHKIHRFFPIVLLLLSLLSNHSIFGQKRSKPDALQQAQKLIADKKYDKAEPLLANYHKKHQNDLETNWLYAQVAHWNKHEQLSAELFEKAIKIAPDNYSLKLDYARMAYESGRTNKALKLLKIIRENGDTPVEALLMEANILFWQGKIAESKSLIASIKQWYPGSSLTKELEQNIDALCAVHLSSNTEYQSDNQPMTLFSEQLIFEKFKSAKFHPGVQVRNYHFSTQNNMLECDIKNRFLLARYGLGLSVSTGIYKHFNDKLNWTGSFELQYKADRNNRFGLSFNRKPYVGTLRSIDRALLQNNLAAEFDSDNFRYFTVHLGGNRQFFGDGNSVHSVGGWLLSKVWLNRKFSVQYGYGYGYSNSVRNVFEPVLPVSELVNQYVDGMSIEGLFNPYFTPQQQHVHTALLMLNYKPSKKLELGLKANYGFYAYCNNPYFFLDKNSLNEIVVGKNYSKVHFNPYDIQANVNYHFNKHFDASIKYHYQETFFFSRNLTSLSLNYTL